MSRKPASWLRLSVNAWQAGIEAQEVIGLRLGLLASGDVSALSEMARMTSEKISAALEVHQAVAAAVLTGNAALVPSRALAVYRRKMRANKKRLSAAPSRQQRIRRRRGL